MYKLYIATSGDGPGATAVSVGGPGASGDSPPSPCATFILDTAKAEVSTEQCTLSTAQVEGTVLPGFLLLMTICNF